ncbi:MAG: hypothetical protein ACKKL6_00855 [Candidatus Komeilibacteria bacterium]
MKYKLLQNNILNKRFSITHNVVIRPMQMRYIRLYHQRSMALVSDLLIIVGVMVMFIALIFFWNHPITSNRYIDLQMNLNSDQVSGQAVSYKIYWENDNRNSVDDVYMSLMPPKGFVIDEVLANGFTYQEKDNLIVMGELLPGANGEFEIKGKMWVDISLGADWDIRMYYKNLGLRHNKTLQKNITYSESLLDSNISTLEKVYLNNYFPINIKVVNNSEEYLPIVYVNLELPEDFEYAPVYAIKDNTWYINGLKPGEERDLTITGRLTYLNAAKANFGVKTGITAYDSNLEQRSKYVAADYILPRVDLDLSLEEQNTYMLGQQYSSQIYYNNRESYDLEDVQVRLYSGSAGLKAEFNPGFYSYKEIGVEKEDFLKSTFVINRANGEVNKYVNVWAELSWKNTYSDDPERIYVFSEKKTIQASPDLNLEAKLYYFTPGGDQIGYGPLPPVVGEATSYWVSIRLWPSFGEVDDLKLTADLGDNVRLVEYNTSLGNVVNGNNLTWSLDSYSTSWYYQPQPRLNLHLEITPSEWQVGNNVVLLKNITASALSLVDKKTLNKEIDILNNSMLVDNFWPNDGKIIP